MLNLIWAEARNGVIGKDGKMPWHSHEDMVHFRQLTTGHPVVMGRKTFVSLGERPLPHRQNLVLTHHRQLPAGVEAISLDQLKELVTDLPSDIFVIGGASVYQQLLPLADRLFRTIVDQDYSGETKMPPVDYDQWQLVDEQNVVAKKDGEPNCRFQTWQRSDVEQD